MVEHFDILGLGCTAVDDLLYVENYPAADTKAPIRRQERQGGGLTGTALVAAARMGARCQYAGSLGGDELSRFVKQRFQEEGVGLDYLSSLSGFQEVAKSAATLREAAPSGRKPPGITQPHLDRRDDPRPVHSIIIVDESRQTRTIFFDSDGAGRARVD